MPQEYGDSSWKEIGTTGFMAGVGQMLCRRAAGGGWDYGLQTGPEHVNPAGLIHGGVLMTLADHAMSLVAWEAVDRQPVLTAHLAGSFITAARPGDFLVARSIIEAMTSSTLFLSCRIESEGREIMVLNGSWRIASRSDTGRRA